ncbi:MAG: CoA-binding protein [Syntrophothermus sp.]
MEKKTVVIGASPNRDRFSHRAVRSLVAHSVPVVAIGLREGNISGINIQKPFPVMDGVHTVTLYVGKAHQPFYYDFILDLNPQRVIFNPGTENPDLEMKLKDKGVEIVFGCTLVMLVEDEF